MERPIFVVFEGLDGSGKSTCARRTADLLGAKYLTTPSESIRKYCDAIVSSYGSCQEAAQLIYLSTVFAASSEAKTCLDEGKSVVLDRYYLSTQVYAEFRGARLDLDDTLGKLLFPADRTVFLDVPLEIRRQRLGMRNCSAADNETLTVIADSELRKAYDRRVNLPVVGKWLRIDASADSPDDIARSVTHKQ
jgi:dTMP kinase